MGLFFAMGEYPFIDEMGPGPFMWNGLSKIQFFTDFSIFSVRSCSHSWTEHYFFSYLPVISKSVLWQKVCCCKYNKIGFEIRGTKYVHDVTRMIQGS